MRKLVALREYPSSYNGRNNRKMTLARYKQNKVQSIPVFEKDEDGRRIKLLGFKNITHQFFVVDMY